MLSQAAERTCAMNWIGVLCIAGGLFSMAGAICDWEWFMNSRKARGM